MSFGLLVRTAATASVVLLALTGCDAIGTPTSEPSILGTELTAGPPPQVGECQDMPPKDVVDPDYWFDGSPSVRCSAEHTTETAAVWELREPSIDEAKQYAAACERRASAYLDHRPDELPVLLGVGLHLPSKEEVSRGQSWVRCDVFMAADTALTSAAVRTGSLEAVLGAGPVVTWACAADVPTSRNVRRLVSCTRPHRAKAVSMPMLLRGQEGYPVWRKLVREGERQCTAAVADVLVAHPVWEREQMFGSDTLRGVCWVSRRDGKPFAPVR